MRNANQNVTLKSNLFILYLGKDSTINYNLRKPSDVAKKESMI